MYVRTSARIVTARCSFDWHFAATMESKVSDDEDEDPRTKKSRKRGWKEGDNDGDWDGVCQCGHVSNVK